MRSVGKQKSNARINALVVDNDGALRDDVTRLAEEKGFLRTGSRADHAFTEFMFLLMRASVGQAAKKLPAAEMEKKAIEVMADVQGMGKEVLVCTANPIVDADKIEKELASYSIIAKVVEATNTKKALLFNDGTILVEDDPLVALRAAKNGAEVVLLMKPYNRITSFIFGLINEKVHVVADWKEAASKVLELIEEREYTPMIRKEQGMGVVPTAAEA